MSIKEATDLLNTIFEATGLSEEKTRLIREVLNAVESLSTKVNKDSKEDTSSRYEESSSECEEEDLIDIDDIFDPSYEDMPDLESYEDTDKEGKSSIVDFVAIENVTKDSNENSPKRIIPLWMIQQNSEKLSNEDDQNSVEPKSNLETTQTLDTSITCHPNEIKSPSWHFSSPKANLVTNQTLEELISQFSSSEESVTWSPNKITNSEKVPNPSKPRRISKGISIEGPIKDTINISKLKSVIGNDTFSARVMKTRVAHISDNQEKSTNSRLNKAGSYSDEVLRASKSFKYRKPTGSVDRSTSKSEPRYYTQKPIDVKKILRRPGKDRKFATHGKRYKRRTPKKEIYLSMEESSENISIQFSIPKNGTPNLKTKISSRSIHPNNTIAGWKIPISKPIGAEIKEKMDSIEKSDVSFISMANDAIKEMKEKNQDENAGLKLALFHLQEYVRLSNLNPNENTNNILNANIDLKALFEMQLNARKNYLETFTAKDDLSLTEPIPVAGLIENEIPYISIFIGGIEFLKIMKIDSGKFNMLFRTHSSPIVKTLNKSDIVNLIHNHLTLCAYNAKFTLMSIDNIPIQSYDCEYKHGEDYIHKNRIDKIIECLSIMM